MEIKGTKGFPKSILHLDVLLEMGISVKLTALLYDKGMTSASPFFVETFHYHFYVLSVSQLIWSPYISGLFKSLFANGMFIIMNTNDHHVDCCMTCFTTSTIPALLI